MLQQAITMLGCSEPDDEQYGLQFSSLEPEVVCRLLYVKELEFVDAIAGNPAEGTSAPRPPPGQTELPTCPVCLERLDEHISGVVTTVRPPIAAWL